MELATFAGVRRKIFHLYIKATNEHKYYTTLQAIFSDNTGLGVSKFTLDRYNFDNPYENLQVVIRKGEALGTGDVKELSKKKSKGS